MIERQNLMILLQASSISGYSESVRALAADWLADWPRDNEVQLILAKIEVEMGMPKPAIERLQGAIESDPEYAEAYQWLSFAYRAAGEPYRVPIYDACRALLQREDFESAQAPSWTQALKQAIAALDKGNYQEAIIAARSALNADPDSPLPMLITARAHQLTGENEATLTLAGIGHDRWPACVYFRLLLALDHIQKGNLSRAVEQLHRIVEDDPTGQIACKYLGQHHPYENLWPDRLTSNLSRPIPAELAAFLNANRIASRASADARNPVSIEDTQPINPVPSPSEASTAETVSSPPLPHDSADRREPTSVPIPGSSPIELQEDDFIGEIMQDFERISSRLKVHMPKKEQIYYKPVYLTLSSKARLIESFGEERFNRLDEAINALVEAVRKRSGWSAYHIYIDDPGLIEAWGLEPADANSPWEVKLRLADLDQALKKQHEMIGALLIIGGEKIIPFHRLPNPTDDDDEFISSDNPYATTDENYFVPEWPVGRAPSNDDPNFLINLLHSATQEHLYFARQQSPLFSLFNRFLRFFRQFLMMKPSAYGYSANIWRKASLAVFRTIGNSKWMFTSPPADTEALPAELAQPVSLSYFNLHGLEDAPEWFGQRDPFTDPTEYVDFPVALRPEDIVNGGNAPYIVFTEACYGANVYGKNSETAICMKFLDSGSKAVIGSTKISYGSVTPPLIAADLLGKLFWDGLKQALPVGEALRQAKLKLATEMHRRQGYLDGEDQKTLISFVLYGDPLYSPIDSQGRSKGKIIFRKAARPSHMKTACALSGPALGLEELEPLMLSKVRSIVACYLPGMSDAQCRIHSQRHTCNGMDHLCPTYQLQMNKSPNNGYETLVVTLTKHITAGPHRHPYFARLTLDQEGKILKLAISR